MCDPLVQILREPLKRYLCVSLLLVGMLLVSALPVQGQAKNTYGAPILRMDPHARFVGMGGAASALIMPYGLLRYNPASIGFLEHPLLSTSYHSWIEDTHQNHIDAAFPFWRGGFGVSVSYLDAGSLDEVDADFQPTGATLYSNDIMLVTGGAQRFEVFASTLSLGSSLRYLYRNVAGSSGEAFGFDLGLLLARGPWTAGWSVQNMTLRPAHYRHTLEYLPRLIRAGATYHFTLTELTSWLFALDVVRTHPSAPLSIRSGAEVQVGSFAVRSGYRTADVRPAQWQSGFGIAVPVHAFGTNVRLAVDYTYERPQDGLGNLHSLSVTLHPGLYHSEPSFRSPAAPLPPESSTLPPLPRITPPPLPDSDSPTQVSRPSTEASQLLSQPVEVYFGSAGMWSQPPTPSPAPGATLAALSPAGSRAESRSRPRYIPTLQPMAWSPLIGSSSLSAKGDFIRVHINFDTGKATIRPSEDRKIAQLAAELAAAPDRLVWVGGHTDYEGTFTFNLDLSQRRIEQVLEVLEDRYGIPRSRFIKPTAYGETRPIADNTTAAGRNLNRRVEFHFLPAGAAPDAYTPEGSVIEGVYALNETTIAIFRNGRANYTLIPASGGKQLILDFPDFFSTAQLRPMSPPARRLIRGIQTQFDEAARRTRIIIDLARPASYRIEEGGRVLMLHFDE